jgi:predicted nucleotidyltransferase
MDKPIRFTSQKQQELISRSQLCERLIAFGWIPTSPEDLGEDFIVHIYFQGQATGVTFHTQQKSVTNLNQRRKGDYLIYDFKVKDLKHWEEFSLPVVLIVWDTKLREGRWALLSTVLSELDQKRPKWRTNKSKARVYIPWNNTTDDTGLVWLRQSIGDSMYPLIAKDKSLDLTMTLSFPDTREGIEARKAFERFYKEGEQATFKGRIIQKLEFSEWARPWLGIEDDPDKREVTVGSLCCSEAHPFDITIISASGETASISNVELKRIKAGTELIQLSNDHQTSPLHFQFTFSFSVQCSASVKVNNLGTNVYITRDILGFLQALAAGGELQLTSLIRGVPLPFTVPVPPQPQMAPNPEFLQLIDKLCMIQDKTCQFLQVPAEGLTDEDVRAIIELASIIEHGKTIAKDKRGTVRFRGQALLDAILDSHRQGKPISLTRSDDESYVEVFGQKIQTGRMSRHITGILEMPVTESEKAIASLETDEHLALQLIDVEVVEVFPDWFTREAQRLSQCLVKAFEVESVYLFGSLAWDDVHIGETRIDLAIGSLSKERYLEAASYLERESTFSVNLVDLNQVPDRLRQRILTEGKLLNEQEIAL